MAKVTRENIEGFVGPMLCRKTLYLLDQINAAEAVGENVLVIKPAVDVRFGLYEIRSRNGGVHAATPVGYSGEIVELVTGMGYDLLAIDEGQFFDGELPDVVLHVTENLGIRVAYTALNKNFRGEPFGPVPKLMAISTKLKVMEARCTYDLRNGTNKKCGASAYHTQRLINGEPAPWDSPIVLVETLGEESVVTYTARCERHWKVPGMPKRVNLK
jgi:thymidine kinase